MTPNQVKLIDSAYEVRKRERLCEKHKWNSILENIYLDLIKKAKNKYVELFIDINKEFLENEFLEKQSESWSGLSVKSKVFVEYCYQKAVDTI